MARLLMIHTGGTIGMVPGPDGFEPKAGVAEKLARTIVQQDMPDIDLDIRTLEPLTDSADITPAHWNWLVDLVADAHRTHDGIVVTHGTDTLAYTAAALVFALNGLARPVIVTGAMRPLAREGSDAIDNLRSALREARDGLPGVRVQFAGRSMSGDRVTKVSSASLDAFREIPLTNPSAPSAGASELTVRHFANARIAVLTLCPGMTAESFDAALGSLDGAVLRCYGSGTIPSDPTFQEVLASRIRQGLTVLAISQCEHGGVRPGEYAAGAALRRAGAIDGGALTAEAALAKLYLMLSDIQSGQRDRKPKHPRRSSRRNTNSARKSQPESGEVG